MYEYASSAELRQASRVLDQQVRVLGACRAVHEPRVELAARGGDGGRRLPKVRDVVERIVETEDVDAAFGGAGHEALGKVDVDRPGADEEATAQCHGKRCLRSRMDRTDPLPRTLYAAPYGGVEATAARHLEVREADGVEDLCQPELLGRRQPACKGLLS